MDNPFQIITDAFAPDYQINLSIQGLDGSIMLTLSNSGRIVAKRMISAEQRNDPVRLKRLVQSIQFGIAIEQGHSAMAILEAMTSGDGLPPPPQQNNASLGRRWAFKARPSRSRVFTGTGAEFALRFFDLHRRELRRGVTHHQNRERQQQNAAAQVDDAHVRRVVVRDVGDQQAVSAVIAT
jgi:hypothetical protein